MSAGGSTKAIIAAFLANLGIAIAKFVAFLFTGSASMLAESVHSLADTGNQGLLLLGGKKAKKEATPLHQFGFGRERYFWAFVVSIILFTLGGLFAMYEGVHKIETAHEHHGIEGAPWAIGVLLVAIVLEGFSFRTAINEANHVRRGASWASFIRRSKSPELPVVILEDFGALIGLVLALGAVVLSVVTGNAVFDGIGTLCIGVLLFIIAIVLSVEMKSLLIGEAAAPEDEDQITAAIDGHALSGGVIHLRTEHIGPDELLVVAKVAFAADLTLAEVAAAVDEIEVAIRAQVPEATVIAIEPDVRRSSPV